MNGQTKRWETGVGEQHNQEETGGWNAPRARLLALPPAEPGGALESSGAVLLTFVSLALLALSSLLLAG